MFAKRTIFAHVLVILSIILQVVHSLPLNPPRVTVSASGEVTVVNPLGAAKGIQVNNGKVARFVVKYGSATRWAESVKSTTWQIRDNDPSKMPLACPQPYMDSSESSEDCLYAVLYIPMTALQNSQSMPIYVWHHGGSFLFGSANNAGLDGSKLALATNSIVVVVQYRLGALGLLPPSSGSASTGNLAVKDTITALQFLRSALPAFGGNIDKIIVGGQSSGGHLVRALLAAPTAQGLFAGGTLHSDPMAYGFLKQPVFQSLQSDFYSTQFSSCNNDFNCLVNQPVDTVVNNMFDYINYGYAVGVDASVGLGEPLRPYFDGSLITSTLTTSYPSGAKKPLLISTSKNDGGSTTGGVVPQSGGLPTSDFPGAMVNTYGTSRANVLVASSFYTPGSSSPSYRADGDEGRQALERALTDGLFRCPAWDFARRWAGVGAKVWVGEWNLGATYPSNAYNSYCTQYGRVCHEDEIFMIFGTTPNPSSAQNSLTSDLQNRLKQFLNNPSAGPGGSPAQQVSGSNVRAVQMGGSASGQQVAVGACAVGFWGGSVNFDWQVYGE